MKKVLFVVLMALACPWAGMADLKIGTVDFNRLVTECQQAKVGFDELKDERTKGESELSKEWVAYQKIIDEAKELEKKFSTQAGSQDEEVKRTKQLKDLVTRSDTERERLVNLKNEKEKQYREKYAKLTEVVLKNISAIITVLAKERGLAIVLDTSGFTRNHSPAIQYGDPPLDITAEVLKRVNTATSTKK